MEKSVWRQGNFVTGFIPFGHDVWYRWRMRWSFLPGENVDAVVKRASHRDIDFLNATADSKDRDATRSIQPRTSGKTVLSRSGSMNSSSGKGGAAIVVGFDVRAARPLAASPSIVSRIESEWVSRRRNAGIRMGAVPPKFPSTRARIFPLPRTALTSFLWRACS